MRVDIQSHSLHVLIGGSVRLSQPRGWPDMDLTVDQRKHPKDVKCLEFEIVECGVRISTKREYEQVGRLDNVCTDHSR
jgi:hypothetical protein